MSYTSSWWTLFIRRWAYSIHPRPTIRISFTQLEHLHSSFSAVPPSTLSYTITTYSRPWSYNCNCTSSTTRYPLWGFWAPRASGTLGAERSSWCWSSKSWNMPRQLEKCQPRSSNYKVFDTTRTSFIEEIPSISEAQRRWPKGIALGKLGVVCADNRDPRLVLDSTICGMNGRCHLPEKQRLPNLRHVSFFLSTCPPLQDQWQGASIDIKAAHKRMLIREDERGALLFQFEKRLYAYRTANFGAKTSGRVSGALLRLIHKLLYFRHAAWVYVDDFLFLFPSKTALIQFTLAILLLRILGPPLSWKKLEFDSSIEWNGWSIQPSTMTAQLPKFRLVYLFTIVLERWSTSMLCDTFWLKYQVRICFWGIAFSYC